MDSRAPFLVAGAVTDDADGAKQRTTIRTIEPKDDLILKVILREGIRSCDALGAGSGLGVDDDTPLSLVYAAPRTSYFVAEKRDNLVGGAGVGPLPCDFAHIAEIQRFVLLAMSGRLETGRRLLDQCLNEADRLRFRLCYIELNPAQATMLELFETAGFRPTNRTLREPTEPTANTYFYINLASH